MSLMQIIRLHQHVFFWWVFHPGVRSSQDLFPCVWGEHYKSSTLGYIQVKIMTNLVLFEVISVKMTSTIGKKVLLRPDFF